MYPGLKPRVDVTRSQNWDISESTNELLPTSKKEIDRIVKFKPIPTGPMIVSSHILLICCQ